MSEVKNAVTLADAIKVLLSAPMDAQLAALSFEMGAKGAEYLRVNAQKSVNGDFEAEIPTFQAGQPVDGRPIRASVTTRMTWEKVKKANEKAADKARSIASAEHAAK